MGVTFLPISDRLYVRQHQSKSPKTAKYLKILYSGAEKRQSASLLLVNTLFSIVTIKTEITTKNDKGIIKHNICCTLTHNY